jgi:hypothetical protein
MTSRNTFRRRVFERAQSERQEKVMNGTVSWVRSFAGTALLVFGFALVACSGSTGPAGPAGPAGLAGPAGDAGAPGPSNTVWIRLTVATPGAAIATANTVDAGSWGPFNLSGFCYLSGPSTCATFQINSTDAKAKLTDYGSQDNNTSFPADGGYLSVEYTACSNNPTSSDLEGPYDGTFAALSADLQTYITGALTTGVFMEGALADGGSAGPDCEFDGYVTQSP